VRGEADLLICLTSAAAAGREVNKKVATATAMAMEFVARAVWFCGSDGGVWRVHEEICELTYIYNYAARGNIFRVTCDTTRLLIVQIIISTTLLRTRTHPRRHPMHCKCASPRDTRARVTLGYATKLIIVLDNFLEAYYGTPLKKRRLLNSSSPTTSLTSMPSSRSLAEGDRSV
jgi:hypothetical protein